MKDYGNSFRDETKEQLADRFHWRIWIPLTIVNWIFDFGRPIIAVSCLSDLFIYGITKN